MSEITVDDTSPFVAYSGGWEALRGNSEELQSTSHSTTSPGATATIKWNGKAVVIYYTNGGSQSGNDIEVDVILDGNAHRIVKGTHSGSFYQSRFFDTGLIDEREHTLTIRNVGRNTAFRLDYFRVWGEPIANDALQPAPQPTTSSTTRGRTSSTTPRQVAPETTSTPPPTTSTSTRITTSSLPSGDLTSFTQLPALQPSSGSVQVTSSTFVTTSTAPDGKETTITSYQVYTTQFGGDGGLVPGPKEGDEDGGVDISGSSAASKSGQVGLIVGAVVGILVLLLLLAIVWLLAYRRRGKKNAGMQKLPDMEPYQVDGGRSQRVLQRQISRGSMTSYTARSPLSETARGSWLSVDPFKSAPPKLNNPHLERSPPYTDSPPGPSRSRTFPQSFGSDLSLETGERMSQYVYYTPRPSYNDMSPMPPSYSSNRPSLVPTEGGQPRFDAL